MGTEQNSSLKSVKYYKVMIC